MCFLTRVFQDLNKRLSLPADIRIPDGYLEKLQLSSPPFDQPLSRRSRRASLVSFCVYVCSGVCVRVPVCSLIALRHLQFYYQTPSVLVSMATNPVRATDGFIWRHKRSPPTLSPPPVVWLFSFVAVLPAGDLCRAESGTASKTLTFCPKEQVRITFGQLDAF